MKRRVQESHTPATLIDHVHELRKRLLVSVILLVIAGIVAYFFYEEILNILRSPLGAPLYYSNPAGSFAFVMKICTMVGIAVAIPTIVYNLIMFVRPAFLEALPLGRVYVMTVASVLLAGAGVLFAFTFIIPGALHFFAGFQVDGLSALISADSYLSFVTNVIITFAIVFQIPLVLLFFDRIKSIPPKSLIKGEKWVILGGLIVSFMVPFALDLTTSLLIATPIIALYNLSILLVLWQHATVRRTAVRREKKAAAIEARKPVIAVVQPEPIPEPLPALVMPIEEQVLARTIEPEPEAPAPMPKPQPQRQVRSMDIIMIKRPITVPNRPVSNPQVER